MYCYIIYIYIIYGGMDIEYTHIIYIAHALYNTQTYICIYVYNTDSPTFNS